MAEAEEYGKKKIQIYSTTSTSDREVTPYWKEKYERDARKYWDIFYKRHQDKFFKDRHYLDKEWGQYFSAQEGEKLVVLEVGCGAGNTVFPLLSTYADIFVHACDFSPRAIELVKAHKDFTEDRVSAFVCDLIVDDLSEKISPFSVDIVTMVFVLSAVSPEKMDLVLANIRKVLKPTGHVLLRDYATGDLAQERLTSKDQSISENFYVRGDGTRAFYFSIDCLTSLFKRKGFDAKEVNVCCKQVENRSLELLMNRRWIQAAFSVEFSDIPNSAKQWDPSGVKNGHEIGNGSSTKCHSDDFEIDVADSITELFGVSPSIEVIEIQLKDSSFRIKVLGRENQHTCKSTGLMLWESASFMSMVLAENPSILRGKTVLELGCGSAGICSMVAARSAKFVVSTDGDAKAVELLKDNVATNLEPGLVDKLVIRELMWGNKEDAKDIKGLSNGTKGFEVIIGTDVTYNPDAIMPLFETARELISNEDNAEKKPALILCHIQRRADEDSIISAASHFGFRLMDRLVYGRSVHSGIISSWFSEEINKQYHSQKIPLNIMYFQA